MAVKKGTKKNTEVREDTNVVSIIGQIKQVIIFTDSIAIYKLDNVTKSPNNKAIHTYLPVKEFKPEIECEENDMVQITGHIATDTSEYNGKKYYNTFIVVDELEVLDN